MKNLICALRGHRIHDTGNRLGPDRVVVCRRCKRVWAGPDEILVDEPVNRTASRSPWNR